MSNKTVIQKLLTTLEENFKKYSKSHQISVSHEERKTYYDLMTSTETFMVILEAALPSEKQMIMDAYWGGLNGTMNDYSESKTLEPGITIGIKVGGGAEKYYNETFNAPEPKFD